MNAPNARDCEHGQLARSCSICESNREIAELKAECRLLDGKLSIAIGALEDIAYSLPRGSNGVESFLAKETLNKIKTFNNTKDAK
jgi:hypothetical protein